jgi:sugar phosphate permease
MIDRNSVKRILPFRWLIFLVLAVQYLVVYFHRVSPAVVASELIDSFSISGMSLGLLASAYFYPYAVMQVPVGVLSDTWGAKKTIILFSLIASFGAVCFGLAPDFKIAIASRALVGFGLSATFVAVMCILAQWFRPVELARVSGILLAIGGAGWFLATTPLTLLSQYFGWRVSIISVGAASTLIVFFIWLMVEDAPLNRRDSGEVNKTTNRPVVVTRNTIEDLKIIFRNKSFWSIAIWFSMRGGALLGFFGLWAGPYLTDVYKLSRSHAGNVLSMIAFSMIFISPLIGHLSDKTLMSRKKVLVGTSVLNVLCWLVMLLFFENMPVAILYIIFFFMGITTSSVGTLAIVTAKELFPHEMAGTSMGATNLFPFAGAVIFQPFMGYVLDKGGKTGGMYTPFSYRILLWFLFITSIIALISIMQCRETFKKAQ